MPTSFANQVAVVTGASSGIGWALAKILAGEGCKVGLVARRKEKLDALAEEIRQAGAKAAVAAADVSSRKEMVSAILESLGVEIPKVGGIAAVAAADVSNREETISAIHEVQKELGPVDLLIANAGVGMPTLLEPPNTADVETMFRVNVLGTVYAIEAVLPEMLQRRQGHLVAISSLSAYKGLPGESGYCASKAAVNSYMEGLRIHLRDRGIAVTTICPGFVRTPMTDVNQFHMPWLLEADDAARRIVRAIRRRQKVYNFPLPMAFLMKLTSWAPDWLMAWTMRGYNENPPMPK